MLYSPTWTKETKADVFTLASLIAWLETMPPKREYNYYCKEGQCLLDQYLAAHGLAVRNYISACHLDFPAGDLVGMRIANGVPMTFGAALARARTFAAA